MKTAKQVLTGYSDGHYTQFAGYENILMAMEEYAKEYHKNKLEKLNKKEYAKNIAAEKFTAQQVIDFCNWHTGKMVADFTDLNEFCAK